MIKNIIPTATRWAPVLLIMVTIFLFSSIPGSQLPQFDLIDTLIKKGGHMVGYALLCMSVLRAARKGQNSQFLFAFGFTLLYAISDEFHQSFVSGRHPSPVDVGIDMIGASLGALFYQWLGKKFPPLFIGGK